MKFLLLFNILLIIGAVLARPKSELEEDSSEEETTIASIKNDDNNNKEIEKADDKTNVNLNDNKKKPASFFFGQQSHSVFNGNGNSIVVSSRFDSNGREEKYVSVGSPKIRIDGEYFSCANLSCPKDSFRCHVTSEAIADDRRNMKTKAECLDSEDKVLADTEYIESNPHPEAEPPFSRVASVNREGVVEIEDSTGRGTFNINQKLSNEEQDQLDRELQEQQNRMNEMFAYQQRLFQQQMDELNRQLSATFGNPNFPFGNYNPFRQSFGFSSFPSFGFNNWPFTSNFGFRNSFPFSPSYEDRYYGSNSNNNNNSPFRTNVNFDTIEVDRPSNTFYAETSNPTNINPHDPHSINPFMPPQRPTKEIQSEFDESNENDNEIFDDTTNRIMATK